MNSPDDPPQSLPDLATIARTLDERNETGPLRLVRALRALRAMHPGELLKVLASDPNSLVEYRALAKAGKFQLVAQDVHDGEYIHILTPTIRPAGGDDEWGHIAL